jgi:hypothetical protein
LVARTSQLRRLAPQRLVPAATTLRFTERSPRYIDTITMTNRYFSALLALIFLVLPASAQVNVAPGTGTLADAISANGAGTYVLERGGLYLLDGELNIAEAVEIVAADGEGAMPTLQVNESDAAQVLRVRSDFTLRGVRIVGLSTDGDYSNRLIRVNGDDLRVVVQDAVLENSSQSAFRLDNDGPRVFVSNTIIANIGTTNSPDNGRAFDDRGKDIDSLVVTGSTFYNVISRVLRDANGEGDLGYFEFDQNTVVGTGQSGVLSLGAVDEAVITNNIFYNADFFGTAEFGSGDDVNDNAKINIRSVEGQSLMAMNNNFYSDPAIAAAYPDSVQVTPIFDAEAQALVDAAGGGGTNIEEMLTLTSAPGGLLEIVQTYFDGVDDNTAAFDRVAAADVDFGYRNSSTSATAGTDGQPLGDPRYALTTGASVDGASGLQALSLRAYPNPASDALAVTFELSQPGEVHVALFDLLGREVGVLASGTFAGGAHQLDADVSAMPSGLYLVRVQTPTESATSRLTVLR